MAEVFEFTVKGPDGGTVEGDSNSNSSSTQSRREQRQEQSHQLRLEAAARARRREADRRRNQKDAEDRKASRDAELRARNLRRLHDEANRKRLAQERAIIAEENRGQVLRRRFINNFFGTFNQAHLGRRVNHGIDFVRSLFGFNRRLSGTPSQSATLSTRGTNSSSSSSTRERSERSSSSSIRNTIVATLETIPPRQLITRATRARIRDRIARNQSAGLGQRFDRLSGRVGRGRATALLAGRVFTNLVAMGGRAVAALGELGPIGAAAAVGLVAVAGTFLAVSAAGIAAIAALTGLNKLVDTLSKSIESIPSALTFAKIETQFDTISARFERAERLGPGLARIERVRSQNNLKGFDLVNNLSEPLLPLTEALNKILGIGLDGLNLLVSISSEIGFLKFLEEVGNGLNSLIDFVQSIIPENSNIAKEFIKTHSVAGRAVIFIADLLADEKAAKEGNGFDIGSLMKELFKTMNNPVGNIDAEFVPNIGDREIANVFDGAL